MKIAIVIMLAIVLVPPVHAGYTVRDLGPITPTEIQVHGADGLETRLNPGEVVTYPATHVKPVCKAKNRYSSNSADWQEAFVDSAGTATDAAVIAACNLHQVIIDQLTDVRKRALSYLADNSGVLALEQEKYTAATAYKAGKGTTTTMRDGQTASVYLAGLAAQVGMTTGNYAAQIISDTRAEWPTVYQVEQEFLRLVNKVIPIETSVSALLDYPTTFATFCGL